MASTPRTRNRVLIHSNAPTAPTGYGVQTRYLATMLAADGYDVAVSCTWGHQGRIGVWTTPNGDEVRLYPQGWENNSPDVLVGHAEHWFGGDPDTGIIVLLCDVWTLLRPHLCQTLQDFEVVSWTPVDHQPCPPMVRQFLDQSRAHPVAMSRYGQAELVRTGVEASHVPLAIDTDAYKPTFVYDVDGKTVNSRALLDIPVDAFVVGMVAMNKDPNDRKSFGEVLSAFARFYDNHPDAVLYMHTEPYGVLGGYEIPKLAANYGVPPHALIFPNQYAYRLGMPAEMMAATYTAFDVLLSPSRGEGFCVPLIEAQACGTPVIASDFTAQPENVSDRGRLIGGQTTWDPTQTSFYLTPNVDEIVAALEAVYVELQTDAIDIAEHVQEFAADYDYRKVYARHWQPLLAGFEAPPQVEKPAMVWVDVIVPLMRPDLLDALVESIDDDRAHVIVVHDDDVLLPIRLEPWDAVAMCEAHTTYAEKVNAGVEVSTAAWVLVIGDDVEFTPGWFDAAVEQTRWFDVVGTNDSEEGRVRNPHVAAGRHADHAFFRRSYIDDEGSSLDGPGVTMPTAYRHWYVDREVIQLARARGVYGHAHDCRIIHHHPGYDGDEAAREADPVYMMAVDASDADEKMWLSRVPLIEQHRVTR